MAGTLDETTPRGAMFPFSTPTTVVPVCPDAWASATTSSPIADDSSAAGVVVVAATDRAVRSLLESFDAVAESPRAPDTADRADGGVAAMDIDT